MRYPIILTLPTKLTAIALVSSGLLLTTISPSISETFCQKHPRRAEVLRRDARLNRTINKDYGRLDGHFGQLKREDGAVFRQEQRDARMNGGYITRQQQQQLNREENHLHNQINNDLNK